MCNRGDGVGGGVFMDCSRCYIYSIHIHILFQIDRRLSLSTAEKHSMKDLHRLCFNCPQLPKCSHLQILRGTTSWEKKNKNIWKNFNLHVIVRVLISSFRGLLCLDKYFKHSAYFFAEAKLNRK